MYTISTDKSRLDVEMIYRYLSEESYWAKHIPRDLVERSIENSICCDVFVLPSHRGRGVSKQLMQAIRDHPELQRLRRWHLLTRDAHALYEQFGFRKLEKPERHMEIAMANPYG